MSWFKFFKKKKKDIILGINVINDLSNMNIDEIMKLSDKNSFVIALNFWLNRKTNYGYSIEKLSSPEKCVYVVQCFFDETNNGGFEQFLFNSSGAFFGDLLKSLDEIGASGIADIYREAISVFPPSLPKDEDERDNILYKLFSPKLSDKLRECDGKLSLVQPNEIEEIIYSYVVKNQEYFF